MGFLDGGLHYEKSKVPRGMVDEKRTTMKIASNK